LKNDKSDIDFLETQEWIEAIDSVIKNAGTERASFLLTELAKKLTATG
jgi:pyruvate dehydrogenase E1 component